MSGRWTLAAVALASLVAGNVVALEVRQVMRPPRYARGDENVRIVQPADTAAWIWMPGHDVFGVAACGEDAVARAKAGETPGWFFRFRNDFVSDGSPLRLDVSADERFVLSLDGRAVARGPQRGLVEHWYYQSYEVTGLEPGPHRLEATCWQLLAAAPVAQLSFRGGFLLKAEGSYDAALTTGKGAWHVAPLKGTVMTDRGTSEAFGVGNQCRVMGTGLLHEEPPREAWKKAVAVRKGIDGEHWWERPHGWMLFPADRPDQVYETKTPGRIVNAVQDLTEPFSVPAHETRDLWWDLGDYFCGYPELETSGGLGATVTWSWAESLYDDRGAKGDRDAWKGKTFAHVFADEFVSDGRADASFTTPWWRCGRWCRVTVKTADEPLEVRRIALGESRYPLSVDAAFRCDDPSVEDVFRLSRRTIESCLHEMLFDCPYYEQQMYAGDTRIQLQVLNALTSDPRLARFAISVYDWARRDSGFVPMQFPSRANQESCTYTMCWILMHGDFLLWRDGLSFLRERQPGVRHALDGLARHENADGLLEDLPGWSFMDWVRDWAKERPDFPTGCAPCGEPGTGVSALNNLLYLLAIRSAAGVEAALEEPERALLLRRKADRLGRSILERFWSETRGLLADTEAKDCFSEHAQALGILTDVLAGARRDAAVRALVSGDGVAPASTYFSYYVFEALARCGRADVVLDRFRAWNDFIAWGGRTAFETQHIDARSDCHAWSASPVYFLQAAVAGVRPSAPGFRRVRVAPQPGRLKEIQSETPTPKGPVKVDLAFREGEATGTVTLPPGLPGEFVWQGVSRPLAPGLNLIADTSCGGEKAE